MTSLLLAACSDFQAGENPSLETAALNDIWVSRSADRSNPVLLNGITLSGDVYVFVQEHKSISDVTFSLDGGTSRVDNKAPYNLKEDVGGLAVALDTT